MFFLSGCRCPTRQQAQQTGAFVYSAEHDGWIFPDLPARKTKRPWLTENHTGDPYVYVTCPWCGRDLGDSPG